MKLAIYGGSFNPPHLGHAAAIRAVQEAVKPDALRVIPAAIPPHKRLPAGSPDARERLRLAELAFGDMPGVSVSDMELRREGKSYTADTVRALRAENPGAEICLVVGTDMLETFDEWYDFEWLLRTVTLVALARDFDQQAHVQACADRLREGYGAEVQVLTAQPLPVSSTQLRMLLPMRHGTEFLSEKVYAEIIRKRLYHAQPDFSWLREQTYPMLKPRRVAHVWGCEHEARRMAERWGCDADLAAEAGILHDITKKFELSDQLLLSEKYGIINDTIELGNLKLLHAKTGAAMARDLYGVSDAVYDAIRWHTTGRPDMTLLEKIIYMADYIEPTREFPGVDTLRRLAYLDLDRAMQLGLEMSLAELRESGVPAHPNTVSALDWYTKQGELSE